MRHIYLGIIIVIFALNFVSSAFAIDEQIQVYPVQAIFVSDKANENEQFRNSISSDNGGGNRSYAIDRFLTEFKKQFPNAVPTINDRNKYSTFAVFIQIPRVHSTG